MRRLLLLPVLLAACSGGGSSASASCSTVKNPTLLSAIHATAAQSVRAGTDGYFVATKGGATWFTTADPSKDDSGSVLPLNASARSSSTAGGEIPAGSPRFKGHSDDDPGARVARSCV